MAQKISLLRAKVGHRRLWPKSNSFIYNVFYVRTPVLKDMNTIYTPRLFSFNRWNVLSLRTQDYGSKRAEKSWHSFITSELKAINFPYDASTHTIVLVSHPRLFGYAFNPISYWLVSDTNGLCAVLCEVHNTFGDTHNYLLSKPNHSTITTSDVLQANKKLYVSPFNKIEGHYDFGFTYTKDYFKSTIAYFDTKRQILDTFVGGGMHPLTNREIVRTIIAYPFMTILVVMRIHWQAVRLYFKKVKNTLNSRPDDYENDKTTLGTRKK